MNMRKITSLTAFIAFTLLAVTSIVLFIVPEGRVAYWADWRLWALSKGDWAAVHTNLGFLFLLSMLLHIYYNWNPMMSYMKNRNKQMRIFTPDFNISLAVTLVVFFFTLWGVPPFSSFLHMSESIKENAGLEYGEPPYSHAELSPLVSFVANSKVKLDLEESLKRLSNAGIKVTSADQPMIEIAATNGISPSEIFQVIQDKKSVVSENMPEEPDGGTGKKTIGSICSKYQLDTDKIIQELAAKDFIIEAGQTLQEAGAANRVGPNEIYHLMREISLR